MADLSGIHASQWDVVKHGSILGVEESLRQSGWIMASMGYQS